MNPGLLVGPLAEAYIRYQRHRVISRCHSLDDSRRRSMAAYFHPLDLDRVRILEDPAAMPWMPNASVIAGITFDDVIIARVPLTGAFLFHELVHVAQYRILGVSRFARDYMQGFFATRSYQAIPLERCAYGLEDRYNAGEKFEVDREIQALF